MKTSLMVAAFAMLVACGGDDDDDQAMVDAATAVDSGASIDAAVVAIDAATASGSATWQLQPNAVCTNIIAPTCGDGNVTTGYQLIGVGNCPLQSFVTFYFHGGAGAPAAGSYPVRAVTNLTGAANVPVGEVVVRIIHHPNGTTEENWFAQSGSVTVTAPGGKLSANLPLVPAKKDTTALTQMMMATVNCP